MWTRERAIQELEVLTGLDDPKYAGYRLRAVVDEEAVDLTIHIYAKTATDDYKVITFILQGGDEATGWQAELFTSKGRGPHMLPVHPTAALLLQALESWPTVTESVKILQTVYDHIQTIPQETIDAVDTYLQLRGFTGRSLSDILAQITETYNAAVRAAG